MRISDWSSDVCSSDLKLLDIGQQGDDIVLVTRRHGHGNGGRIERLGGGPAEILVDRLGHPGGGRADRKSVVYGKSVSVRVDPGGRRILKKQTVLSYWIYG